MNTIKHKSEKYYMMEEAFKNEIKKSKSPFFCYIYSFYMQRYDSIAWYPFRDRMMEKIDLLRPWFSFYVMLTVATLCIDWISTILLSALIQTLY